MHQERRQYRVSAIGRYELSVVLSTSPTEAIEGVVVNLSIGGMRVFVARDADIFYALGETVYLRLASKHLYKDLVVPSLVYHRAEVDDGHLYGLKFVDWLGLLANLPSELSTLFNRRRDFRYEPSPEHPIEVTVDGGDDTFELKAFLRDLSTAGLSFRAPPAAELTLAQKRKIRVRFRLPGVEPALELWIIIRHRDLIGDSICYGGLFDENRSVNFKTSQETIESYLNEQQRSALEELDDAREQNLGVRSQFRTEISRAADEFSS